MRRYRASLVFALAFVWFSVRAARAWLASGYVDPVGRFGAQDEAFYSRVVMEMLRSGDWLTPTLLDRMAYFKPPLLYWLSALSVAVFGPGHYAFRLPSVLAGAGICALAFDWVYRSRGAYTAAFTVVLLATDVYLFTLSSLNMMDAPAGFFAVLALWACAADPQLHRRGTVWLCAAGLAGGLLTKSVAGLAPAAAIAVYWLLRRGNRPGLARMLWLSAVSILLAAPWLVYTLLTHARWFWTEHVLTEILSSASGAGPLSTNDPNIVFYFQRLFLGDPVTACVCCTGLAAFLMRRPAEGALPFIWLALAGFSLLVFRQHAATYLLPLIISASLLCGLTLPSLKRPIGLIASLVVLLFGMTYLVRCAPVVWIETNNAPARALVDYCNLRRSNALFLFEAQDEFYSLLLPLPRVHYGLIDRGRASIHQPINWRSLGVIVTADQFADQRAWWPLFRERLTAFGLSAQRDPRATTVLIPETFAPAALVAAHPELDFYAPASWSADRGDHTVLVADVGHIWLLAKETGVRAPSQIAGREWACRV